MEYTKNVTVTIDTHFLELIQGHKLGKKSYHHILVESRCITLYNATRTTLFGATDTKIEHI